MVHNSRINQTIFSHFSRSESLLYITSSIYSSTYRTCKRKSLIRHFVGNNREMKKYANCRKKSVIIILPTIPLQLCVTRIFSVNALVRTSDLTAKDIENHISHINWKHFFPNVLLLTFWRIILCAISKRTYKKTRYRLGGAELERILVYCTTNTRF